MNNKLSHVKNKIPFLLPTTLCVMIFIALITLSIGYSDIIFANITTNIIMGAFFNLANIILVFLVFLSSYNSYLATKSTRYFFLSIVFLFLGCLNVFLYIYNLYEYMIIGDFLPSNVNLYALERIIMSVTLYFSIIIDRERITEFNNRILVFILPMISLIFVILIALSINFLSEILSSEILSALNMALEVLIVIIYLYSLVKIYKQYQIIKQANLNIMACALTVFIISQVVFFIKYDALLVEYILNSGFRMIALIFFLEYVIISNASMSFVNNKSHEDQLKLYAEKLDVVIEKRTQKIQDETNQFISELEYAKLIQQSLLPQKRMQFKNSTNFLSEYFPCERLSGDFYDIYKIDEDNIAMYILDVSGHGISAALMTMFCNNYIKSTERLIKRYRGLKPHRNLKHFYDEFNTMNFPEEMHMVIFFASYNVVTKVLTYCSGGMNCEPIIFKKNGSFELLDKSIGFPICKLSEFFQPDYFSEKIILEEGDKVIFYTDGLVDKLKNNIIDSEELIEIFINNSASSAKEINEILVSKINPFADDLDDDISYFIMEI